MKYRLQIALIALLTGFLSTVTASAQSPLNQPKSTTDSKNNNLNTSNLPDSSTRPRSVFNVRNAPWYARTIPFSIYTGAGKLSDRVAQNIEIGKTFNVVDLGVAVGRSSLRPDTTLFVEGRVTMDVANYGIFASEMTIGAGKLFDKTGSLMLELSYTIYAQISNRIGVGFTSGYYDFSNETNDSSRNFYGIYFRYGIPRTDTGGLLGIGRGRSHPGRPGRRGHGR